MIAVTVYLCPFYVTPPLRSITYRRAKGER